MSIVSSPRIRSQQKRTFAILSETQQGLFRRAAQSSSATIGYGEPAIRSETNEGWIHYGRQGWRRGIKDHKIRITVPSTWATRVDDRGLAIVDGLLTLDAQKIAPAPEGIELYRAVWARQGRGLAVETESGIIARHIASGTTYHSSADETKSAVAGLKRKLTGQGIPADVRHARAQAAAATRAAKRAAQLVRLVERIAAWDFEEIRHVVVRRQDSLKAGNCEPGTDQFIERFFPDRDIDAEATIGELGSRIGRLDVAALAGADLTLARQLAAACLVAIRRDRNARRALAL